MQGQQNVQWWSRFSSSLMSSCGQFGRFLIAYLIVSQGLGKRDILHVLLLLITEQLEQAPDNCFLFMISASLYDVFIGTQRSYAVVSEGVHY